MNICVICIILYELILKIKVFFSVKKKKKKEEVCNASELVGLVQGLKVFIKEYFKNACGENECKTSLRNPSRLVIKMKDTMHEKNQTPFSLRKVYFQMILLWDVTWTLTHVDHDSKPTGAVL